MLPELGQVALILALLLAVVQAVVPLIGAQRGMFALMPVARPAAFGQFVFVVSAYVVLTWGFITQDFSIAYVAQNSNLHCPRTTASAPCGARTKVRCCCGCWS